MRAGPLRHLVDIEEVDRVATADGGRAEHWTKIGEAWASIDPIKGDEFFSEQRTQGNVTHRIRLRAWAGLTIRNRIKFGDRIFNLTAVLDAQERGISHECMATEEL